MSGEPLSPGLPASLSVLREGGRAGEAILCCTEQTVLQPLFGCTGKTKMGEKRQENDQPRLNRCGFPDSGVGVKNGIIGLPQVLTYMFY